MTAEKILELPQLVKLRESWKQSGQKVVFTNGCFDILHLGHVDYLEKARMLGDKLIVGLNTDLSVSSIKGPSRPIVPEISRARVMAALAFVDAVVLFGDSTPLELIKTICPDILVKGNDYTIATIVGADFVVNRGGEVKTIELVDGFSTTRIVEKIKKE